VTVFLDGGARAIPTLLQCRKRRAQKETVTAGIAI